MNDVARTILHGLLHTRGSATLATLHEGRPAASLVPFALAITPGGLRLVTHVSRLAGHTGDMRSAPEVCLLIAAPESTAPPQALPRVSIPAVAEFIPRDHADYALLEAAYLARHPQAADLFRLGDFSIVAFTPRTARLVAGFGNAVQLDPDALAAVAADGRRA